jgi:CHAD domain-containing protein
VERLQSARGRLRHWPLSALENRDLIREIRRTYRKGRRALAIYRSEPGPETFHAWRKRVKELWYHLRMVRESLSPAARKRIDRLEAIGEIAGDAHDLIALRQRLEATAGVQSALLIGEIDVRLPEFYRGAVKKGERFYAAAPGDFARRLTDG